MGRCCVTGLGPPGPGGARSHPAFRMVQEVTRASPGHRRLGLSCSCSDLLLDPSHRPSLCPPSPSLLSPLDCPLCSCGCSQWTGCPPSVPERGDLPTGPCSPAASGYPPLLRSPVHLLSTCVRQAGQGWTVPLHTHGPCPHAPSCTWPSACRSPPSQGPSPQPQRHPGSETVSVTALSCCPHWLGPGP